MRYLALSLLAITFAGSAAAQQQAVPEQAGAGAVPLGGRSNLATEQIGVDDMVGVVVYGAPELSRTVRVESDGAIRLPMVRRRIAAAGLGPAELETSISNALTEENILVDPDVSVSVAEYHSRPITVAGAVRTPVTFQAVGTITLLEAITRAGGISENAGPEILVSRPSAGPGDGSGLLVQRIPVHSLLNTEDPALDLRLEGGEDIRVPEAGRVFVLGRVKHPGAFSITDGSQSSVMKALALSDGLDTFPSHKAYIYRVEGGGGHRNEIPIDLKNIMKRKSPDVALMSNDILYIPDATGARAGMQVLTTAVGMSLGAASLAAYH